MAFPLLGALAVLTVAQTGYGILSNRKSAKAARKAAAFEAGMLEDAADDALLIGQEAANRTQSAARRLRGAQTTSQAASGVDVTSGSAADVIASDARLADIDTEMILQNAQKEALGLRKSADLVRMGGRNTAQSYNNQAVSTLLSGAMGMYGLYSAWGLNRGSSTPRRTIRDNSGGYGQR